VTYGTTHVYSRGSLRNRLVRLLPGRLRQRFGAQGPTLTVGTTNITLWMERDSTSEPAFLVCDETGMGVAPEVSARMSSGGGSEWVEGWSFATFPRRQKELTVRVFGTTAGIEAGALAGEWKIPNPVFRKYPVWTPEPLPATRSTGDLAVTLHELKTGVGWPRAEDSPYTVQFADLCICVVFSLTQNGAPTEDWVPVSIETSDATGNRRLNTSWSFGSSNGWYTIHYQWGLWPGEAAWRLKVELSRRANFAPDELWTARDLSLSETNLSHLPASQTTLQGTVVQLQRLVPSLEQSGVHTLFFSVSPHREGFQFTIVEVTDELGRTVAILGHGENGINHTVDFRPASDAKSLNVTFALHPSRFVEFTVKPEMGPAPHPEKETAEPTR